MESGNEKSIALRAAFMMRGLETSGLNGGNISAVLQAWDQGFFELVDELLEYVPILNVLIDACEAAGAEYPAVLDYEVSTAFGAWFAGRVIELKDVPPTHEAIDELRDIVLRFFIQEVNDDSVYAKSIKAAIADLAAIQQLNSASVIDEIIAEDSFSHH